MFVCQHTCVHSLASQTLESGLRDYAFMRLRAYARVYLYSHVVNFLMSSVRYNFIGVVSSVSVI